MNVQNGEYVIYTEGQNEKGKHKYHLMKVTSIDGKIVRGTLAKNSHLKALRQTAEVSKKDIVLNLGTEPYPGTVYGNDTSKIFRERMTHEFFGTLYFFYRAEDETKDQLFNAMSKVYKTLAQQKLEFLVDPTTVLWEIYPHNGEKYAGSYRQSRKPDELQSIAMIRPESCPHSEWKYVLFHELAHHVDFHYLHRSDDAKKLRAQWVRLYKESMAPEVVTKADAIRLRDALFEQEDPPSAFQGQLEEEDAKKFKAIISWFGSVYSLSREELDTLWGADYKDDLKDIWPTRISKKGVKPLISEYSSKKPCEFFAEALAFYWSKKPLPKNVVKLVEKTLSFVKTQREA